MLTLTREDLARFLPRAQPAWLDALARLAPDLTAHYGFTRLDWVHFAGQLAAETNGLSLALMTENMRFTSARRIKQVYRYRLKLALRHDPDLHAKHRTIDRLARHLVGKPDDLADIVYAGPTGREGTPPYQGHKYIGRGPFQITHLNGYAAVATELRRQPGGPVVDLVARPERLCEPDLGVRSAFADWAHKGLSRWAQADDGDAVSAALNTGSPSKISITNGLDRRRRWTARAKAIWPNEVFSATPGLRIGDQGANVAMIQLQLRERGYQVGKIDGQFGTLTRRAVVALQIEHGLPANGVVDDMTREVLIATGPADLGKRAKATSVPGSKQQQAGSAISKVGTAATAAGAAEAASQTAGYSLWGTFMDGLGNMSEAVGKVTSVGLSLPKQVVILGLVTVIGIALWRYGAHIWQARLDKHRAGLDISR